MAAGPAGSAVAPQPGRTTVAAGAGMTTVDGCRRIASDAARAAVAEQQRVAADAAGRAGAARTAGATAAEQQAAVAAVAADRSGAAGAAVTAPTQQARRTARATGLAGRTGSSVAAVADQQPARAAGLARRTAVGAVADQRAAQQRPGRGVDHVEHSVFGCLQRRRVGRLGRGVGASGSVQGLQELLVKGGRLGADRLVALSMLLEECGDLRGHLVGGRGQHRGGRVRRCGTGGTYGRTDLGHRAGRRGQCFRDSD